MRLAQTSQSSLDQATLDSDAASGAALKICITSGFRFPHLLGNLALFHFLASESPLETA
jgi:hypothetical protein